jgi:PilZ domain
MSERNIRRHQRIPYIGPVRISWQESDGPPSYIQGKCLDVSKGGLRVESPQPIPARTLISLRAERLSLSGSATVRHAQRRGAKYILGLELNAALLERTLALAEQAAASQKREA